MVVCLCGVRAPVVWAGDVARLMDALASASSQLEAERKRTQDLASTLTAAEDAITTLRTQHDASNKVPYWPGASCVHVGGAFVALCVPVCPCARVHVCVFVRVCPRGLRSCSER
jgi:hypothetical protein